MVQQRQQQKQKQKQKQKQQKNKQRSVQLSIIKNNCKVNLKDSSTKKDGDNLDEFQKIRWRLEAKAISVKQDEKNEICTKEGQVIVIRMFLEYLTSKERKMENIHLIQKARHTPTAKSDTKTARKKFNTSKDYYVHGECFHMLHTLNSKTGGDATLPCQTLERLLTGNFDCFLGTRSANKFHEAYTESEVKKILESQNTKGALRVLFFKYYKEFLFDKHQSQIKIRNGDKIIPYRMAQRDLEKLLKKLSKYFVNENEIYVGTALLNPYFYVDPHTNQYYQYESQNFVHFDNFVSYIMTKNQNGKEKILHKVLYVNQKGMDRTNGGSPKIGSPGKRNQEGVFSKNRIPTLIGVRNCMSLTPQKSNSQIRWVGRYSTNNRKVYESKKDCFFYFYENGSKRYLKNYKHLINFFLHRH